jgi:Holliday junction resolvase
MKNKAKQLPEPSDVLYRIKRGLSGYVSYLAACEMNASFTEYMLYEPILRILTARGYAVECEVECPGVQQPTTGDKKRLDFVARKADAVLAIEVKWIKRRKPTIQSDLEKLVGWRQQGNGQRAFLCVFGTESCILGLQMPNQLTEKGKRVIADFGKTKFGCRIYELT